MKNFFISKLSGKTYIHCNKNDQIKFAKQLQEAGLTKQTYADKFFKCVSDPKHNRQLKPGQFFIYKKINFSKETYQKVIIDGKWKCQLCEKFYATSTHSFWSHVSRVHKLSINDYLNKVGYTQQNEKILCSFCGREAQFKIQLNPQKKTYIKTYKIPRCNTQECNDKICLQFFGKHYCECKKQFQHIGRKNLVSL